MSDPNIAFPALKLFLCVMRTGSLAAAARESGLSPSGVSRQIAALEQELGFRLFDRTTRRLAATEAGALYHERMAPLVRAMDEAAQIAGDRVRAPSGLLKVTASIAFAERWLIPRLPAFRATYPEIELDLMLDDAPLDLSRAGIDVAFRLTSRVTGDVVVSKLMDTRYRVVASPDYVTRHGTLAGPDDLRHRACISFT
ncbi:MAG: LysR family transcriptional regulator, partial [Pseudomonadota bacterium]